MAFIRRVKTSSGATAVQIAHKQYGRIKRIEHIEAHLTIVLTALAIGKSPESQTGMSIKQLVKTLRPIRSGIVTINGQEYIAEEDIPPVIHTLLQNLRSGH